MTITTSGASRPCPLTRRLAALTRAATLPPVMALGLLLLLWALCRETFSGPGQLLLSILFLAVSPTLAYPVWAVIPPLRKGGRPLQRKLAFVTTFAGYFGAVIYGLASRASADLMFVCLGYAFSYLALLALNLCRVKASGHACGVVGPLILFLRATAGRGVWFVLPCVVLFLLVIWSSLKLKRHTPGELAWGASTALMGYGVAMLIL